MIVNIDLRRLNEIYTFGEQNLNFFSFLLRKLGLHKIYQMSGKHFSHIWLMWSVYKSFHQTVKYGQERNHILQDLTGLEI